MNDKTAVALIIVGGLIVIMLFMSGEGEPLLRRVRTRERRHREGLVRPVVKAAPSESYFSSRLLGRPPKSESALRLSRGLVRSEE